jgi:hypothetical protein
VSREVRAADYIELERGFNDSGLGPAFSRFGIERFMSHIDWVHRRRRPVVLDGGAESGVEREYGLAGLFLIAGRRDALGNDPGSTPRDWWRGYDVRLGAPKGQRYRWFGLLRRDFQRGFVLLNDPDAPTRIIDLGATLQKASGKRVNRVTLGPAAAAVLRIPDPSNPPPPPQPPDNPQPPPCFLLVFCNR